MSATRFSIIAGCVGLSAITCIARGQSIGPLKETRDQGKTWQPERSDRPNRPAPVAPPPTPAQQSAQAAAAAAAAAEAQREGERTAANERGIEADKRGDLATAKAEFEVALKIRASVVIRENLGGVENKLAIAAENRGDLAEAERGFEAALAHWDHPQIRKNLENVRAEIARRQREQREWRDAPTVAKMRGELQQLEIKLGRDLGKFDFDGTSKSAPTTTPIGLDFVGLSPKASAVSMEAAAALVPAREVNSDAMIVDLRDAKALVVDPTKVAGGLPPAAAAQPLAVIAERAEQAKAVFTATDPAEQTKAQEQLRDALNSDLRRAARTQAETHRAMLDDMRMLNANGPVYTEALAAAQQRIRAKELAALKVAEQRNAQDIATELERVRQGGNYDPKRCDEILAWLRNEQAGILRDGYQEMAAEVARLRQQLVIATKGQPIIPINPESQDLLEELLFPETSQSKPDVK